MKMKCQLSSVVALIAFNSVSIIGLMIAADPTNQAQNGEEPEERGPYSSGNSQYYQHKQSHSHSQTNRQTVNSNMYNPIYVPLTHNPNAPRDTSHYQNVPRDPLRTQHEPHAYQSSPQATFPYQRTQEVSSANQYNQHWPVQVPSRVLNQESVDPDLKDCGEFTDISNLAPWTVFVWGNNVNEVAHTIRTGALFTLRHVLLENDYIIRKDTYKVYLPNNGVSVVQTPGLAIELVEVDSTAKLLVVTLSNEINARLQRRRVQPVCLPPSPDYNAEIMGMTSEPFYSSIIVDLETRNNDKHMMQVNTVNTNGVIKSISMDHGSESLIKSIAVRLSDAATITAMSRHKVIVSKKAPATYKSPSGRYRLAGFTSNYRSISRGSSDYTVDFSTSNLLSPSSVSWLKQKTQYSDNDQSRPGNRVPRIEAKSLDDGPCGNWVNMGNPPPWTVFAWMMHDVRNQFTSGALVTLQHALMENRNSAITEYNRNSWMVFLAQKYINYMHSGSNSLKIDSVKIFATVILVKLSEKIILPGVNPVCLQSTLLTSADLTGTVLNVPIFTDMSLKWDSCQLGVQGISSTITNIVSEGSMQVNTVRKISVKLSKDDRRVLTAKKQSSEIGLAATIRSWSGAYILLGLVNKVTISTRVAEQADLEMNNDLWVLQSWLKTQTKNDQHSINVGFASACSFQGHGHQQSHCLPRIDDRNCGQWTDRTKPPPWTVFIWTINYSVKEFYIGALITLQHVLMEKNNAITSYNKETWRVYLAMDNYNTMNVYSPYEEIAQCYGHLTQPLMVLTLKQQTRVARAEPVCLPTSSLTTSYLVNRVLYMPILMHKFQEHKTSQLSARLSIISSTMKNFAAQLWGNSIIERVKVDLSANNENTLEERILQDYIGLPATFDTNSGRTATHTLAGFVTKIQYSRNTPGKAELELSNSLWTARQWIEKQTTLLQ